MYTQKGISHLFKIPTSNAKMKPIDANGRETLEQIYARLPDPKPDILFNGVMFDYKGGWPTGGVKIDGKDIQPKMGVMQHILGVKGREVFIETHNTGKFTSVTKDMDSALESYPLLLPTLDSSGLNPGLVNNRHPRTAVGTSDGFIHLLITDGRNVSPGLTSQQARDELKSNGAKKAINLDGGNSTKGLAFGVKFNNQSVNSPIINAIGIWFDELPILNDTLRKGSKGVPVMFLQKHLGITIDGAFGPVTENAVKSFQYKNRLTSDGIVGPKTWKAFKKKSLPESISFIPNEMPIIQDFASTSLPNIPNYSMNPNYITVHNTGNADEGADAEMHSKYIKNGAGGRSASWHFSVDDKVIYQHIPTDRNGWHCTDGANGPGNRGSIGVEICENEGIDMAKAEANAIWLIRLLMNEPERFQHKNEISLENVVPHFHWYNKNCPSHILPRWGSFIDQIVRRDIEMEVKPTVVIDEKSQKKVDAFIINNVTYAPVREIAEASGRMVFWDGKNVVLK